MMTPRRRAERIRATTLVALGLLGLAGVPAAVAAAPAGSLDPSFGAGSGVVSTPVGSQLFGVAVQPSGEIVAVGQSSGSILAERFSASGELEAQYVGAPGTARAVTLQSDGKVVLAGTSQGAMVVERLEGSGSSLHPDPSFAGGLASAFAGASAVANAVAIAPNGAVVAAGSVNPPDTRVGVARFTSAGLPDPSFNGSGSEVPGYDHQSSAQGVAVQPDGKIVLVGHQSDQHQQVFNALIARLNPNGSSDATFVNGGSGGAFTFHYGPPGVSGYTGLDAVTLQNDGKIVAGGVDLGGPSAIFLRLNPGGGFDTGFGSNGAAALPSAANLSFNAGGQVGAYGVGIAGGGRIVGGGMFEDGGSLVDAAAWALSSGGVAQTGFGNGGVVTNPTNPYESCALAVAPDGSLVSVGDTVTHTPIGAATCVVNGSASGFVARYVGFGPAPRPGPGPVPGGAAPTAATGASSGVSETAATVAGQVNPDGLATSYEMQYGTSVAYGAATTGVGAGSGTSAVGVSVRLARLRPGTTYHYRLVAANADGTSVGADRSLRTLPRLKSALRRTSPAYRTANVLGAGVRLTLTCDQACRLRASLTLSRAQARRLGLGHRRLTIANVSGSLPHGGKTTLRLRFASRYRLALLGATSVPASLQITASPQGGGPSVGFRRMLTLRQ